MSIINGRVWKYGDSVNTDVIFPGKYTYTVSDPADMPQHALEDLDPCFAAEVRPGDIIVAGKNWGCGSSREQAVTCLKESGVGAIVAESFARIYYRNCLNAALPALTCAEAVENIEDGQQIEIDLEAGEIRSSEGTFSFPPLPEAVMGIFAAGGLVPYTRQRIRKGK
ncbi:MAG: 3-isopropylmalate dehydratase small subunit [Anaerolineae bacterium]|nr:MAG: 3-isopropylmalate dehydratase small subunit [Anaerolineae bacterium]